MLKSISKWRMQQIFNDNKTHFLKTLDTSREDGSDKPISRGGRGHKRIRGLSDRLNVCSHCANHGGANFKLGKKKHEKVSSRNGVTFWAQHKENVVNFNCNFEKQTYM